MTYEKAVEKVEEWNTRNPLIPRMVGLQASKPGGYRTRAVEDRIATNGARDKRAHRTLGGRQRQALRILELFQESPDKRVRLDGPTKIAVLNDLQIPFNDPAACDLAIETLDRVGCDTVVLNGDVVDCYAESAFTKDYRKALAAIPEEHRRVADLLDALLGRRVIWMGGNHEDRWRRVLWGEKGSGPTAVGMLALKEHQAASGRALDLLDHVESFKALFNLDVRGVEFYPWSHRLYVAKENLIITHGKYVSRHSGYAAKRSWEWLGTSCIVGHTHRMGTYMVTQDGREQGAWENGCLCQLEPEYDDAPNWQQGMSLVRVEGSEFNVVPVHIVRRQPQAAPRAVFQGEL